jgi:hypothetical protein
MTISYRGVQQGDGDGEANRRYRFVAVPVNVRDRMFKDAEEQAERQILRKKNMGPRFRKEKSTQGFL